MIVVTGATGNVGGALTRVLAGAGQDVTAVSRRPAEVPAGVRHVAADLSDPAQVERALDGASALFLLLSGDMHAGSAGPSEVVARAVAGGVGRVVLLSSQGVSTRPRGTTRVVVREIEDAVRGAGATWSILRPGGFASNALGWAGSVRADRVVAAPFGDVGIPVVDPLDIAEVAAACLVADKHSGAVYELTGPEVITPRQQAAAIADAIGEPVGFQELTREQAKAFMVRAVPADLADDTLDIIGAPLPAEVRISPDVEHVLGRAPRPFADWVARNVAAFR
ncbi:SDR family oxidoreductase [Actinokineospora bangkokensis]|uniref:NmrA family transcriptional regulator n=1 Tax=Actinokineospora bangkokensis TaxID=1193682 RepID=A0A1Q9LIG9_9PSEU|nr:NAD(P)H-binding protein [Actinokineospora bangkokensis]OLR91816.1 NmrA family transcriptional regulator [Actinokineospora bangkokensis]